MISGPLDWSKKLTKVHSLFTNLRRSIVRALKKKEEAEKKMKKKLLNTGGYIYMSLCVCVYMVSCASGLTGWDTATVSQLIPSDHVHGCLISQSHTSCFTFFPLLFDISNPFFSLLPFFLSSFVISAKLQAPSYSQLQNYWHQQWKFASVFKSDESRVQWVKFQDQMMLWSFMVPQHISW